jgi:hypothetical protein
MLTHAQQIGVKHFHVSTAYRNPAVAPAIVLMVLSWCRIWRSSFLERALRVAVEDVECVHSLTPPFARIGREVDAWGEAFKTALTAADPKFEGEILGSYRRGDPWSSDVDFVIRHKDYDVVRCRNSTRGWISSSADTPLRRRTWTLVELS